MVVVHQRISQLNSSGLMNIDVYTFARLNDVAFGCIEDLNLINYQVGVIKGARRTGIDIKYYDSEYIHFCVIISRQHFYGIVCMMCL